MSVQAQVRHKQFAEKIILEFKRPAQAYAEVYGHDPSDATARVNASKLLTDTNIKAYMAELSDTYKGLALWALKQQIALALNPATPASVKNKIYDGIITRAGYPKTHRVQMKVTEQVEYPEFNLSVHQLHAIIREGKQSDNS